MLLWQAATGELIQEIGGSIGGSIGSDGERGEEPGNACFNEVGASDAGDVALVSDDGYIRLGRLDARRADVDGAGRARLGPHADERRHSRQ